MSQTKTGLSSERSYEEAILRIEEIVQCLETGDISLEESLSLFEEGIGLAKYCTSKLDAAEGRLEILLGTMENQAQTAPFKPNTEDTHNDNE